MMHPLREEVQEDGRIRRWARIKEAEKIAKARNVRLVSQLRKKKHDIKNESIAYGKESWRGPHWAEDEPPDNWGLEWGDSRRWIFRNEDNEFEKAEYWSNKGLELDSLNIGLHYFMAILFQEQNKF